ncbi:hypothetical protein JVT61DRAFT_14857 [Boletus reticuloceps]|uniref:Uncharacterized protein n=1 Tax=Boletus reticuloceps TaxID=495285 RepID=A0A8I2YCJ7_9AGAM|nr:hypothetical protein JVT61DRAFT_14857 [Boletus reticuloceps]
MPRDPTRRRKREDGMEVCNHRCKRTCVNKRSRSILWAKEGNSCVRHAKRMDLHPNCQAPCPASTRGHYVRDATPDDFGAAIKSMLDANMREAAIDVFFSKNLVDWKEGRANWPELPVASDHTTDFDDVPQDAGPSHQQFVDVADERRHDGNEDESDDAMDLLPIPAVGAKMSQTTSRSASIATSAASSAPSQVNPFLCFPEPDARKTIKLLYIPDPSRSHDRIKDVAHHLSWVKRYLAEDHLASIQHLKGFYVKARTSRDDLDAVGLPYRMTEWLWVMTCLSDHRSDDGLKSFDISYMTWEDFKDVLVDPRSEKNKMRWDFIRSHELLIGGLDYTIDTSDPHCAYNLHGDDRRRYDATLSALMQVAKFWPPVPSLQMAGYKWNTVAILDMIAVKHGWRRPKTTLLTPGCPIPAGTVLKRSHSDCGDFVILPEEDVRGTGAAATSERDRRNALRTWEELNARTSSPEQRWVSQDYVDSLAVFGEWRFFIVGGHVICTVHTMKMDDDNDVWHGRRVWQFRSLAEIRELWRNHQDVPVTADVLVNPQTGDRRQRAKGWEELRSFIDAVYRGLVIQESNPSGLRSSLTVFCRMDIGLMFDGEGNPSYFVNEIERTPTMSMWLKVVEDTTNRFMFDTFARVLHSHVTRLDDLYTF